MSKIIQVSLVLLLMLPTFASGQIEARFSSDKTAGCPPLLVSFTNESIYPADAAFLWDFGNGRTSTARQPQTIYSEPGDFTVVLIVSAGDLADTLSVRGYISTYAPPVVSFTINNDGIGCIPAAFEFSNHTTISEGAPVEYTWSFGDGSISHEKSLQYIYEQRGIYDVSLVVTDVNGCTSSHTEEELVRAYQPVAKLGADQVYSCNGTLITHFNDLSEAVLPLRYVWDFGDGTTSHEPSPTHIFHQVGRETVKLKVMNTVGCEDSVVVEDLIVIENTRAVFSLSNDTICPGQKLALTNASEDASLFQWDFGDGSVSGEIDASKQYANSGDYFIRLRASNGICQHDSIVPVHVEHVIADFQATDTFLCQVPQIVQYQNLSQNAVRWEWRFGNGVVTVAENPGIQFEQTKVIQDLFYESYSDTLIAISKHGCRQRKVIEKSVEVKIPNVRISADDVLTGCLPKTIHFSDNTIYDTNMDEVTSWSWMVDGRIIEKGAAFTYEFTNPGNIPVELVVETSKGCIHSNVNQVSVGNVITPDFIVKDGTEFCASENIYFKNTSPDLEAVTNLRWEFGDGNTFPFPVDECFHTYTDTGYMDVKLTVFNYGCQNVLTKKKAVYIKGPVSLFTIENNCSTPHDYHFIGNIIDADSYTWDFGDGSAFVEAVAEVDHSYLEGGNYRVTLSAQNSTTGCNYELTNLAYVRNLKSKIRSSQSYACLYDTIHFDAEASIDAVPFMYKGKNYKYLWTILQEEKEYFDDLPISHLFKHKGYQQVALITQDVNECRDTAIQTIRLFHPSPDFESNHQDGCMPITFAFNDLSTSDTTLIDWMWKFGDDFGSNDQNPLHEYMEFGSYNVSLEVKDALGCINQGVKKEHIKAILPDASFIVSDPTSCLDQELTFSDLSKSEIISYKWDFGDASGSKLATPSHSYTDTGYFSVSLSVMDVHGCEGSGTKTEYIHIQKPPIPDFMASATQSNCYPFLVQFTDLSETDYPGSWHWKFGDESNHSSLQHPSFIYSKPDSYNVTLVSSSSYGCSDTLTKNSYIHVGGPYASMVIPDTACRNKDIQMIALNKRNVHDLVWDFGDGYTLMGDTVYYQYSAIEQVYPSLYLRSDANNTCNKVIRDTIEIFKLVADYKIENDVFEGCVPMGVVFQNQSINASSVLWHFGEGSSSSITQPAHQYDDSGVFSTTLIVYDDTFGCSDTLSKYDIDVHPLPQVSIINDTLICRGDNLLLFADGGESYSWSPDKGLDHSEISNPIAEPDSSLHYSVEVTDTNGCKKNDSVWVAVQQVPLVVLRDTTLIIGESFGLNLDDNGIKSYTWTPDRGLSCVDCAELLVGPLETTHYNLAVTDTSDCFEVINDMNVEVLHKFSVALPSAFTPNGDGINDIIYVKGWGIKALIEFSVYNRFGEKIYTSSELSEGWDGTFKGEFQPIETYSYLVKAKTYLDDIIERHGYFKILK